MKMGVFEFIVFGLLGISLEVLFTGIKRVKEGNIFAEGHSYIWMLPVYGSWGIFFDLVWPLIDNIHVLGRGFFYMCMIYIVEFSFGNMYHAVLGRSPWIYEGKYNIQGIIQLAHAPVWFGAGLLFEVVSLFILGM